MSQVSFVRAIRVPFRPLKRFYVRQQEAIRFKSFVRPSDIFLVGHPKSGNTLMAYMFAIVVFRDFVRNINLANIDNYVPGIHFEDLAIVKHGMMAGPRVFRNEVPLFPQWYPRAIYLVRDPRAVLVSYYHMYRTIFNDTKTTIAEFVDEYLRNGNIQRYEPQITRWDRQVSIWLKRAERDSRIMIVPYEKMVKNKPEVLEHVLEFASVECSDALFEHVLERSSFAAMRKTEEEFGEENYPGEIGKRGRFIRRGEVSGWKEELPPESVQAIEREFGPVMKKMGYL